MVLTGICKIAMEEKILSDNVSRSDWASRTVDFMTLCTYSDILAQR